MGKFNIRHAMKIRCCSLVACVFTGLLAQAQVAFNTTGALPDNSAMLDVTSTTKGLLVPRMTTAARTAITSPATGLLIYDNSLSLFYFYNGTAWAAITAPTSPWTINGNGGTVSGTDFLGTADNQALEIKTNNTLHTRIRTTGQIDVLNTGGSVYLGDRNALGDDLNNHLNVGIGNSALLFMTTGTGNTAIGFTAMQASTGSYNTLAGYGAMANVVSNGVSNTGLGQATLLRNSTGSYNTALGGQVLSKNNIGNYNTGVGGNCLINNTSGIENTGMGANAINFNTTGSYNTGIGYFALTNNSTGSNNIAIGRTAYVTVNNLSNATAIGYNAQVAQNNSLVLGGTGADAVNVGIGTTTPLSTLDLIGAGSMAIKSGQVAGTNNPDNTASVWRYTSGTGTITLPDATVYSNRLYMIANITGATLNISSYFDLSGTVQTTLASGASIMIASDGISWLQIR
jgi:hypothetical protein